ncbi:MAG: hypothetical protein E6G62_09695 [Actinobacteria bacterium]|nr:MAG: hypothetical protein E6G62_09695 [Actinomycetota bacterium]
MTGVRAALLTTGLFLIAGQAPALAAPSDIAATRTYIRANYALVQSAGSHLASARAAYRGVLRRVKATCPGAGANSPQNPQSTQLSNGVIGAMVTAAIHTNLPALGAYVHAAERTRWSNRALTRAVHAYAGKVKTMAALASPDLCGDVKAWVATGFQTLSPRTVSFDQRFVPAWVALGELPPGLAAYERPDERALLQRSGQLEMKLSNFEAGAVESYGELMNTLGVLP